MPKENINVSYYIKIINLINVQNMNIKVIYKYYNHKIDLIYYVL